MSLVKSVAGAPGYALAIAQQTTGHPSLQSIMVYLLTLLGTPVRGITQKSQITEYVMNSMVYSRVFYVISWIT